MYDGVTPSRLPANATMVAGYVNGLYANMGELAARFPHAIRVGISVTAGFNGGTVLDVEIGDATPAEAPGWVKMRRAAGVDPTVYCNTSTWPAVRSAFHSAGVSEPHYWIAQYDTVPNIPAGAIAKQYQNTAGWDASVVADYWPGVDPKPKPAAVVGHYLGENLLAYLTIPANVDVDIPVEPAGTTAAPQGGARNGPMWVGISSQSGDALVAVSFHTAKGWGKPATSRLVNGGGKTVVGLPTDGSVDVVRIHSNGAPVIAYITGRQVA